MKRVILIAGLALAACGTQQEPIEDYNAPYLGGKDPVAAPPPPPTSRLVPCPNDKTKMVLPAQIPGECKNHEDNPPVVEEEERECVNLWNPNMLYATSYVKRCASLNLRSA